MAALGNEYNHTHTQAHTHTLTHMTGSGLGDEVGGVPFGYASVSVLLPL